MIIWSALLIPLLVCTVFFLLFGKKITFPEFISTFFIAFFFVLCSKLLVERIQTQDIEYRGGYIVSATYEEQWDEYVRKTCTRTISCGKNCTTTQSYDCSYVDDHPPKWYFDDTLGHRIDIDEGSFNNLTERFKNKEFVEMNRKFHKIDGDAYRTIFKGERELLYPITREYEYQNKVQASNSIFKFKTVTPKEVKEYSLYNYPKVTKFGNTESVLGVFGEEKNQAEKYLQYLNATFGSLKEVRLFILVFKNQPIETALLQESYWAGGNKNEFILCIGTDKENKVTWGHVISWTENEKLKVEARAEILKQQGKKLNTIPLIRYLEVTIPKEFKRKNFSDFDYLTVEPPLTSLIIVFILTFVISIGMNVYCVVNDYDRN